MCVYIYVDIYKIFSLLKINLKSSLKLKVVEGSNLLLNIKLCESCFLKKKRKEKFFCIFSFLSTDCPAFKIEQ